MAVFDNHLAAVTLASGGELVLVMFDLDLEFNVLPAEFDWIFAMLFCLFDKLVCVSNGTSREGLGTLALSVNFAAEG